MSPNDPSRRLLARRERLAAALAVIVWTALASCGWWTIAAYSYTTLGDGDGTTAATWPANSQLPREAGRSALVVFLHPKCPCSRATLTELERLLEPLEGAPFTAPQVIVVAATPPSPDDGWTAAPLVERSRRLPDAHVVIDQDGVEATRFGALNSGTVMLYDPWGRRTYRGGVTAARGHEGRSTGGAAVAQLLAGGPSDSPSIPAFGCRLVSHCAAAVPGAATP